MERVLERIEKSKEMQKLKEKYQKLMQKGQLVKAISVKREMDSIIKNELKTEEDLIMQQYISVREIEANMQEKDLVKFRTNMDVMSILIDVVDTCILNMNEALKNTVFGKVIAFDKFIEVGKECKRITDHFKPESDEHNVLWADTLDSIESYLFMRATAYHKKAERITQKQQKNK